MIDIDKLTEAQVRYILKAIYDDGGDYNMENTFACILQEDDYPQQINNEAMNNDY